jgi:hypothetical protein
MGGLGCDSGPTAVSSVRLLSPSGRVELSVTSDAEGRMSYTVALDGAMMVESSPLGLVSTTHDLSTGVTMPAAVRSIEQSYVMLVGKRRNREVVRNRSPSR